MARDAMQAQSGLHNKICLHYHLVSRTFKHKQHGCPEVHAQPIPWIIMPVHADDNLRYAHNDRHSKIVRAVASSH